MRYESQSHEKPSVSRLRIKIVDPVIDNDNEGIEFTTDDAGRRR